MEFTMPHSYYITNLIKAGALAKTTKMVKFYIDNTVGDDFDFIAVRGVSGTVIGSALSVLMDKPLVVVRKTTENSHANNLVEYDDSLLETDRRFIIVDDFIATGSTVSSILTNIRTYMGTAAQFVGFYGFNHSDNDDNYSYNNNICAPSSRVPGTLDWVFGLACRPLRFVKRKGLNEPEDFPDYMPKAYREKLKAAFDKLPIV